MHITAHIFLLELIKLLRFMLIRVAARSNARTVFSRSNTVGSNPTRGMYIYGFILCLCCEGWFLVEGVLPTVYKITKLKKKKKGRAQQNPVEPLMNELSLKQVDCFLFI
jgi:hypothetical protein